MSLLFLGGHMTKQKHLTLSERIIIEKMLNDNASFKAIGRKLNKDCTTISKEVLNHRLIKQSGGLGRRFNDCLYRSKCTSKLKGTHCSNCNPTSSCGKCSHCSKYCSIYIQEKCTKLNKYPYVCNSCPTRHLCTLEKSFYSASFAHEEYKSVLSESRSGALISEQEREQLDQLISPLIRSGQPIYHIMETYKDSILWSDKTIRNYIDKGILTARNIDLPRKVKFKLRKCPKHDNFKVDKECRIGRKYTDYNEYLYNHDVTEIVQMDSVEGQKGGKILLTLLFTSCNLILAYIRDSNDSASVINVFNELENTLGHNTFKKLFPVILTDNGTEFSNPLALEKNAENKERCRIYYCDPSSPYQKGKIETTHSCLRPIIPKGKSLDNYTQTDIQKMVNHVNSTKREMLNGKTALDMFEYKFGKRIAKKLGLEHVIAKDIVLNPSLLK